MRDHLARGVISRSALTSGRSCLILALTLSAAFSCQSRRPDRKSGSSLTAAEMVEDDRHRLVITKATEKATSYKVALFSPAPLGTTANIKWGVRSRTSIDGLPNCNLLANKATVTLAPEKAPPPAGMLNAPNYSFNLRVDPALFIKPKDTAKSTAKISRRLQQSGYFAGPMQLEVCLSDGKTATQGWGVPRPKAAIAGLTGGVSLDEVAIPDLDDPVAYGKLCAEKLGPLPAFDCRQAGEVIPITVDGEEVDFGKHKINMACDRPPYLGLGNQGNCIPYARLGRLDTGKPDVDTVFICRRYKIGEANAENTEITSYRGPDVPLHEDVAVVQHNRITGETCFFQALAGFQPNERSLPTRRVPPPDEEALPANVIRDNRRQPDNEKVLTSSEFWIKPSEMQSFACSGCHDSDPYLLSPYVMQMSRTLPDGTKDFVVPCDPAIPGQIAQNLCHAKDGKGLYKMISRIHNAPNWEPTRFIAPKDPSTQACVSCHRIGSRSTCNLWAKDSMGAAEHMAEFRTNTSKTFPQSIWMPLFVGQFRHQDNETAHGMTDQAAWTAQYQKAKDAITECCDLMGMPEFDAKCTMTPTTSRPDTFRGSGQLPTQSYTLMPVTMPLAIKDASTSVIDLKMAGNLENEAFLAYGLSLKMTIHHDYIGQLKVVLRKGGRPQQGTRIDLDEVIPLEPDVLLFDGSKSRTPAQRTLELNTSSDQPDSPLKPLIGAPVAGTWQVVIQDTQALEEGQVLNFQLTIQAAE